MLKVLLGGIVTKEGMGLTDFGIVIIDTDGTAMKNDTLKSAYNGADKFDRPININSSSLAKFLETPIFHEYRRMQRPQNEKCISCPFLNVCGGGMLLHRWKAGSGFNNPSIYCADQVLLIAYMQTALDEIYLKYA